MSTPPKTTIYDQWMQLWNGDLALAPEIVAANCRIHQAPFGAGEPQEFRGPDGLVQMVEMGRSPFQDVTFRAVVGPITDGDYVAARWEASGTYAGGIPGATAKPGRQISFHGNDILRLEDGKIAEYWVSSDGAYLMAQLGMV
jgi:predicted ester cyclase